MRKGCRSRCSSVLFLFFRRRFTARWRHSLLNALLLLRMSLRHLLCLLLMTLFDLLSSSLICVSSIELLVLFFLLALKFLPIFFLLRVQLFLLLLVFLILLAIAGVGRSRALGWRKIVRMDGVAATSVVHGTCIAGTCISTTRIPTTRISSGRMMKRAGLSRGHDSGLVECSRLGSSSDSRLATINRGTQLWIRAGFL